LLTGLAVFQIYSRLEWIMLQQFFYTRIYFYRPSKVKLVKFIVVLRNRGLLQDRFNITQWSLTKTAHSLRGLRGTMIIRLSDFIFTVYSST